MRSFLTVVVTSISPPNEALRVIADGCRNHGHAFVVIGDEKSPAGFRMENCEFVSLEKQLHTGFKTAELCPLNTYSRKNIGYLLAMRNGSEIIVDTDDDNLPLDNFWAERSLVQAARKVSQPGWINVYKYFNPLRVTIWPRGLPLDRIHNDAGDYEQIPERHVACPIQQGLVNGNPDVDAVYRLTHQLPVTFRTDRRLALGQNTWSPFNSQNTFWWKQAFPLMYLPSSCSPRMTDIWRSFVAQRIAWENDWCILYHEPTVIQERNEHDLLKDFADEIPGYLRNAGICNELEKIRLKPGTGNLVANLQLCYEKLITIGAVGEAEMPLLNAWAYDLQQTQVVSDLLPANRTGENW